MSSKDSSFAVKEGIYPSDMRRKKTRVAVAKWVEWKRNRRMKYWVTRSFAHYACALRCAHLSLAHSLAPKFMGQRSLSKIWRRRFHLVSNHRAKLWLWLWLWLRSRLYPSLVTAVVPEGLANATSFFLSILDPGQRDGSLFGVSLFALRLTMTVKNNDHTYAMIL